MASSNPRRAWSRARACGGRSGHTDRLYGFRSEAEVTAKLVHVPRPPPPRRRASPTCWGLRVRDSACRAPTFVRVAQAASRVKGTLPPQGPGNHRWLWRRLPPRLGFGGKRPTSGLLEEMHDFKMKDLCVPWKKLGEKNKINQKKGENGRDEQQRKAKGVKLVKPRAVHAKGPAGSPACVRTRACDRIHKRNLSFPPMLDILYFRLSHLTPSSPHREHRTVTVHVTIMTNLVMGL